MSEPRSVYHLRHELRFAQARRLEWRGHGLALVRMILLLAAVGLLISVFSSRTANLKWIMIQGLILAALAALFFGLGLVHDRMDRRRQRLLRAAAFYERGLARLDHRWMGKGRTAPEHVPREHLYHRDLDLFGRGSLFELLCTAVTRAGEERLAEWLMAPAPAAEVLRRQEAVRELAPLLDLREEAAQAATATLRQLNHHALQEWAASPPVVFTRAERIIAAVLSAAALAALVYWFATSNFVPLVFLIAGQYGFHRTLKKRMERIKALAHQAGHDLRDCAELLGVFERQTFHGPMLKELSARLYASGAPPSRLIRGLDRRLDLLEDGEHNRAFIPLARLLFWSLHCCHAIERWRVDHGAQIPHWFAALGDLEALCTLAGYRYEHPADPFPEIADDESHEPVMEGQGLGHPLLPDEKCVRNDIILNRACRLLIVSGSNMSGKSTYLRTLGVNAVLALAGAPVRATRLRLSPFHIGASIRSDDSLQDGYSRFFMEITHVRAIIEQARKSPPLLYLIDEIFHGTNSHDRLIATEAIARRLMDLGAVGLITTHDLALTRIAEQHPDLARNVHFEDRMEEGKMKFDYTLRPGTIQHGNALALMRSIGLEV